MKMPSPGADMMAHLMRCLFKLIYIATSCTDSRDPRQLPHRHLQPIQALTKRPHRISSRFQLSFRLRGRRRPRERVRRRGDGAQVDNRGRAGDAEDVL